jgi:hypothetical protein
MSVVRWMGLPEMDVGRAVLPMDGVAAVHTLAHALVRLWTITWI